MEDSPSRSPFGRFLTASFAVHALALGWLQWSASDPEDRPKPPPILYLRLSELPPAPELHGPAPVASAPAVPLKTAPRPKSKPAPAPIATASAPTPAPKSEPVEAPPAAPSAANASTGPANSTGAAVVAALPGVASGPSLEDELERYEAELARLIAAHKHYPALARRRGIEGSVLLRLTIDARGRLEQLETPGRAPLVLVSQARSAAERAAPFPPPPAGQLKIDFVLRFDLDE